jgi:hypothetical protein
MNTLSDQVKGIMEQLGKAFLISGYLPAAIFLLVHQLVLFPRWTGHSLNLFGAGASSAGEGTGALEGLSAVLSDALNWLLLPLLLGMLLLALNTFIINLFEGKYPWQRATYLEDAWKRNQKRCQELYGDLLTLKQRYSQALLEVETGEPESDEWRQAKFRVKQLPLEIQQLHHEIQAREPVQVLPLRPELVAPTALGNAWAMLEEYPYDRYGMDGMIFWPRLRGEVDESFDKRLTNQKTLVDFLLNVSFLMSILGVELLITGIVSLFARGGVEWRWVVISLVGMLIGWGIAYAAYQAAVSNTRTLGVLTNMCWDFGRDKLAARYGLTRPDTLLAERKMWLRLGNFLRTGEGFYFPSEYEGRLGRDEEE